jgi:septum formation protein
MSKLILASSSPRRKKILKFLGIPFKSVAPRGVVEKKRIGESARQLVGRLALEKALSIHRSHHDQWVLGADTLVAQKGIIYGKPRSPKEALRNLRRFSGAEHQVLTGMALVAPGGEVWKGVGKSQVYFRKLQRNQMSHYARTSETYDKAGGYDIQGSARGWIRKLEGDYFNVMGLPAALLLKALAETGFFKK